jgi:hypothetical protein
MDNVSGWSAQFVYPQDTTRLDLEKGRCEQDLRQRFTTSYVYQLPGHASHALGRQLFNGWETSGVLVLQTGFPFNVTANDLSNGAAGSMRANYIGGNPSLDSSQRSPTRWFNTDAFSQPAPYTFGNTGRSILDGPALRNVDLALMKVFQMTEQHRLQFRTEVFNVFNHPYFHYPVTNISSPGAGSISSTSGDNRIIQLSLKYLF